MVLAVRQVEYHLNKHQHSEEFGLTLFSHPGNWACKQSFDLFMTDNSMEQISLFCESPMSMFSLELRRRMGLSNDFTLP